MTKETSQLNEAKKIASKELSKMHLDPEDVFKSIEAGLAKFLANGDRELLDEYLDKPENEQITNILTEQREELGELSVLHVLRKAIEQKGAQT